MQSTATINECAIQLNDLPPKLKPYDIFPQITAQFKVNILGVLMATNKSDIVRFDSKRCFSMIEELVIKPNQHLVTGMPQYKKSMFDLMSKDDMEAYEKNPAGHGIISGKKRFVKEENKGDPNIIHDMEANNTSNNISPLDFLEKLQAVPIGTDECVILAYDDLTKTNELLTKDIFINRKLVINKQTVFQEKYMKKILYSKKNLKFRGSNYSYLDFDIGLIQNDPEEPGVKLFRTYWSLENLRTYGCSITSTRAYFHTRNPEKASLAGLLTLDLVFQVDQMLELRVSIDFERIETYTEKGKVYWVLHLLKHPLCYFYPLKADEYLAFHLKNWRRTPNFLLGAMPDNLDRLYLGNRSVLRLCFDQGYHKKTRFLQEYENKLIVIQRLDRIKPNINESVKYTDVPLNFNSQIIEQSRVPFDIKFLIVTMISRAQIDVYTLPDAFLEKIWGPVFEKKMRSDIIKRALEMIMLNKNYDKKLMPYEKFKTVLQKYLKVVKFTEKIMDNTDASKSKLTSFDANLYSFEVQITPSCMYYLCSDPGISKAVLYKFPEYIERFLLVKFIDENLEPMKTVRSVMGKLYYRKYLNEIKLFSRNYEFFCFQISQLENRAFWAFSPDKNMKSEHILKFLETKILKESEQKQSGSVPFEYMTKISDEFGYSYDTLDVRAGSMQLIKLLLTPDQNEEEKSHPRTFEGFISGDILDDISKKFRYGNIPGIMLRSHGQSMLLIRNPDTKQKKSIEIFKGILQQADLDQVEYFEIIDIPHYRPAFLNRHRIVLFESLIRAYYRAEMQEFENGINTFLRRFVDSMQNPEQYKYDSFNRVIFGSKFSNNAVKPIMSSYKDFPLEEFFCQLYSTVQSKTMFELMHKMKIFTEFGANLVGIIDYTGKLKKGEVYYSIDNPIWKPFYKENLFAYVAVIRKPALDHSINIQLNTNFQDIRFFEIKTIFENGNPFENLQNCIVFSKEDRDFVLDSCSEIGPKRRAKYFQILWDQHLLPEHYKNKLVPRENPKVLVKELIKDAKDIEDSQSFYFDRETQSTLNLDDDNDEYNNTREISRTNNNEVKFTNFKIIMVRAFLNLIKNPRVEDLKRLHLVYADTSKTRCGDPTARFLSECYRDFCLSNLRRDYDKVQIFYLLNILDSSRYLPVPSYNREIKSSFITTTKKSEESLLSSIYSAITLVYIQGGHTIIQKAPAPGMRINKDLVYKDYRKHLKHALKVLILYKYDIQKLCFLYGCSYESQLFIGFNREDDFFSKNLEAPNFGREFINLKDYLRALTKKYRQLFSQNLNSTMINGEAQIHPNNLEEAMSKASAWYVGSLYQFWKEDPDLKGLLVESDLKNLVDVLNEFEMNEIYGLPWVAAYDILTQIKKQKQNSSQLDESR